MLTIPYIRTPEGITVLLDGVPKSLVKDTPQFEKAEAAFKAGDEEALRQVFDNPVAELKQYGDVEVLGGQVKFRGQALHNYLVDVILRADDPQPVAHFLDNVMKNPSRRAVQDLYRWCEASKLPITSDGCIVAYKIVGPDYYDLYSHTFDNTPGKVAEMPRNEVDEDPTRTCSHGLHFCSADYLPHYGTADGNKVILVKVNPADVVAFPTDYNLAKARCCRHESLVEVTREEAPEFFGGAAVWSPPSDMVFIRDTRDGDYVVEDGDSYAYQANQPEPMTRAAARELLDKIDADLWEIVPVEENDDWSFD